VQSAYFVRFVLRCLGILFAGGHAYASFQSVSKALLRRRYAIKMRRSERARLLFLAAIKPRATEGAALRLCEEVVSKMYHEKLTRARE